MRAVTNTTDVPATVAPGEGADMPTVGVLGQELTAPGHLYNPRTGTGLEWLPPNPNTGESGEVRLWARQWNQGSMMLAAASHNTSSAWEYWYSLEFATSFPQVSTGGLATPGQGLYAYGDPTL
jgi:hypothetical protein